MGIVIVILIICLLTLGFGMHLAGGVLKSFTSLCILVLLFTFLSRLGQRAARRGQDGTRWPRLPAGGDSIEVGRVCPNPRCGRVNEHRARFCARCGTPLP